MRRRSYRVGGLCMWHAVTKMDTEKGGAETDPSTPMSAEILPRLTAPMTSSAVSASSNVYRSPLIVSGEDKRMLI